MKELEPYKSYVITEKEFNIYMFALGKTWVAIKYGADDYVEIDGYLEPENVTFRCKVTDNDNSYIYASSNSTASSIISFTTGNQFLIGKDGLYSSVNFTSNKSEWHKYKVGEKYNL